MPPRRIGLLLAGVFGFLGVGAGAFGAHTLADKLDPRALEIWRTGAHYQLVHALLIAVVAHPQGPWPRTRRLALYAPALGIVVFSGSLYALALGAPRFLGMFTPLGGLCFLVAWFAIAVYGLRAK